MSKCVPRDHSTFAFAAMLCLYKNNLAAEVEEALQAAFIAQELPPEQLIVVFDGPVPIDVSDVIGCFEETHDVKRVVFNQCRGHGVARAAAVNACEYDWLAIIDADDISMPNRFSNLYRVIEQHPEAAVIGGGLVEFHSEDGEMSFGHTVRFPETPVAVRRYIAARSPIAQPTSILRVAAIKEVGNYQTWFNNEDYHLWIRLVAAGYGLWNVQEPILWFRTSPDLFVRRGGFKYWWNEVKLQLFSYNHGTTTLGYLMLGAIVRFAVQVLLPAPARKFFYSRILRKL